MQIVLDEQANRYGVSPYASEKGTTATQTERSARETTEDIATPVTSDDEESVLPNPITTFLMELTEYLAEAILMGVQNNSETLLRKGSEMAEHAKKPIECAHGLPQSDGT